MSRARLFGQDFVLCHHDLSAPAQEIAVFMHAHRDEVSIEHLVEYLERAIPEAVDRGAVREDEDEFDELERAIDGRKPKPKIEIGTVQQRAGLSLRLLETFMDVPPNDKHRTAAKPLLDVLRAVAPTGAVRRARAGGG